VVTDGTPRALAALEEQEVRVPLGGGALPYALSGEGEQLPFGLDVAVEGDELVFAGAPRETGSFSFSTGLTDALGTAVTVLVPLEVARLTLPAELLIEGLASPSGSALTPGQRDVLDRDGNGNGAYDAGDLRAYLFGGG
jgi:hypothetical protein